MIGEGEYNIEYLKKVVATDSYLGLDQDARECQNEEPYYNCTTRQYRKTIYGKCGCLPLNMQLDEKVSINYFEC